MLYKPVHSVESVHKKKQNSVRYEPSYQGTVKTSKISPDSKQTEMSE